MPVNPLTIEAQVQGGMVMGLGTTLPGARITLKDGVVQQSNWHDYRIPTHAHVPRSVGASARPASVKMPRRSAVDGDQGRVPRNGSGEPPNHPGQVRRNGLGLFRLAGED
jgi:hypothetical protein